MKSTSFCFFRICWYVAIFVGKFLLFINYELDVHMASPPSIDASGASQTTGDILCGRAHGNVFNHADGPDPVFIGPCTGKVFVYGSPQVPDLKKSETSIKCEVTPQIKFVLKALAQRFSPVSSKSYFSIYVQHDDFILYQSSIKGSMFMKMVIGLPKVVMKLLLKIMMTSCGPLMRLIHSISLL